MIGIRYIICFCMFFPASQKRPAYVIVAGDISCKACVIQLHQYLSKKTKKENLCVAFRDKGNVILNESGPAYYKEALPKARYIILNDQLLFPAKEKYPYLLKILRKDTLKIPYDSLFVGDGLNSRHLR